MAGKFTFGSGTFGQGSFGNSGAGAGESHAPHRRFEDLETKEEKDNYATWAHDYITEHPGDYDGAEQFASDKLFTWTSEKRSPYLQHAGEQGIGMSGPVNPIFGSRNFTEPDFDFDKLTDAQKDVYAMAAHDSQVKGGDDKANRLAGSMAVMDAMAADTAYNAALRQAYGQDFDQYGTLTKEQQQSLRTAWNEGGVRGLHTAVNGRPGEAPGLRYANTNPSAAPLKGDRGPGNGMTPYWNPTAETKEDDEISNRYEQVMSRIGGLDGIADPELRRQAKELEDAIWYERDGVGTYRPSADDLHRYEETLTMLQGYAGFREAAEEQGYDRQTLSEMTDEGLSSLLSAYNLGGAEGVRRWDAAGGAADQLYDAGRLYRPEGEEGSGEYSYLAPPDQSYIGELWDLAQKTWGMAFDQIDFDIMGKMVPDVLRSPAEVLLNRAGEKLDELAKAREKQKNQQGTEEKPADTSSGAIWKTMQAIDRKMGEERDSMTQEREDRYNRQKDLLQAYMTGQAGGEAVRQDVVNIMNEYADQEEQPSALSEMGQAGQEMGMKALRMITGLMAGETNIDLDQVNSPTLDKWSKQLEGKVPTGEEILNFVIDQGTAMGAAEYAGIAGSVNSMVTGAYAVMRALGLDELAKGAIGALARSRGLDDKGAQALVDMAGQAYDAGRHKISDTLQQDVIDPLHKESEVSQERAKDQLAGQLEEWGVDKETAGTVADEVTNTLTGSSEMIGRMAPMMAAIWAKGLSAAGEATSIIGKIGDIMSGADFYINWLSSIGDSYQQAEAAYGENTTYWDALGAVSSGYFDALIENYEMSWGLSNGVQKIIGMAGMPSFGDIVGSVVSEDMEELKQTFNGDFWEDLADWVNGRELRHPMDGKTQESMFNLAKYLDTAIESTKMTIGMDVIMGAGKFANGRSYTKAMNAVMDGTATPEDRQLAAEIATAVGLDKENQARAAKVETPGTEEQHNIFENAANQEDRGNDRTPGTDQRAQAAAEEEAGETAEGNSDVQNNEEADRLVEQAHVLANEGRYDEANEMLDRANKLRQKPQGNPKDMRAVREATERKAEADQTEQEEAEEEAPAEREETQTPQQRAPETMGPAQTPEDLERMADALEKMDSPQTVVDDLRRRAEQMRAGQTNMPTGQDVSADEDEQSGIGPVAQRIMESDKSGGKTPAQKEDEKRASGSVLRRRPGMPEGPVKEATERKSGSVLRDIPEKAGEKPAETKRGSVLRPVKNATERTAEEEKRTSGSVLRTHPGMAEESEKEPEKRTSGSVLRPVKNATERTAEEEKRTSGSVLRTHPGMAEESEKEPEKRTSGSVLRPVKNATERTAEEEKRTSGSVLRTHPGATEGSEKEPEKRTSGSVLRPVKNATERTAEEEKRTSGSVLRTHPGATEGSEKEFEKRTSGSVLRPVKNATERTAEEEKRTSGSVLRTHPGATEGSEKEPEKRTSGSVLRPVKNATERTAEEEKRTSGSVLRNIPERTGEKPAETKRGSVLRPVKNATERTPAQEEDEKRAAGSVLRGRPARPVKDATERTADEIRQTLVEAEQNVQNAELMLREAQTAQAQAVMAAKEEGLEADERARREQAAQNAIKRTETLQKEYDQARKAADDAVRDQQEQAESRKNQQNSQESELVMNGEGPGPDQERPGNAGEEQEKPEKKPAPRPENELTPENPEPPTPVNPETPQTAQDDRQEGTPQEEEVQQELVNNGEGPGPDQVRPGNVGEEQEKPGRKPAPVPENEQTPAPVPEQEKTEVTQGQGQEQAQTPQTAQDNRQTGTQTEAEEEEGIGKQEGQTGLTEEKTETGNTDTDNEEEKKRRQQKTADDINVRYGFNKRSTDGSGKTRPGLTVNSWDGEVSDSQRVELQVIHDYAKEHGFSVIVDSSITNPKVSGRISGEYNGGANGGLTIRLAQNGTRPLRTTLGHELYHMIKNLNKDGARRIEKLYRDLAGRQGVDVERLITNKLVEYRGMGIELSPNEAAARTAALEEVIADSMYDIIGDERTMRALTMQDRSLAERIMDWVDRVMKDIHRMLDKYGSSRAEAKVLHDQYGAMENMRAAVERALAETKELRDAKKAATSLGSNSRMLDEYRSAMDAAESREDMNAATLALAGQVLEKAGVEQSWDNIRKLLTGAAEYVYGGGAVSQVLNEYGMNTWIPSDEANRAFVSIGRYMKQMLDAHDEAGYAQILGMDADNTAKYSADNDNGRTDIRYSADPVTEEDPSIRDVKDDIRYSMDADGAKDMVDLGSDIARADQSAWQLIDTIRQMKMRMTQDADGAAQQTPGYWKKMTGEIAKSLQEYTYGKDQKTVEKAVRELFSALDGYDGDARGFVEFALREAQSTMRDLYTDDAENPTRDNLKAFFEQHGPLYVTPEQKKELQYFAGGMTAFRRQAAGLVPITSKKTGVGLEEIWSELAPLIGKDPDIVSVGTMIMEFNDAVEKARSVNGMERTLSDEEIAMLDRRALDLVAEYMQAGATVVPTRTVEKVDADRHQEALREVGRLQEETDRQQEEIDRLNRKLEQADAANQSLNRQVFDRAEVIEQLKQGGATRAEVEEARAAYRAKAEEAAQAVQAMKDIQKKLEEARAKRDEYRKELAQARRAEQAYEKAQHQIERLQAGRDSLKKQIEKLKLQAMDTRLRARQMKERRSLLDSVRKIGGRMRNMLASPSEAKGYIPLDHVRAVADLAEAMVNNDGRASAAKMSKRLENAIRDARESTDYNTSRMYEDELNEAMREVTKLLEDKGSLNNLSNTELEFVSDTLTAVEHQIRTSNETIGRQKNEELGKESADAIRVMRENPRDLKGLGRLISRGVLTQLNPQRFFAIWGHHGDNAITRMGEEASEGQRKKNKLTMDMTKKFEALTQGENEKKFDKFTGKHATWYDTGIQILNEDGSDSGRTWKMNGAMRAFFGLSWQAEENREGMRTGARSETGGELYQLTIPDEELMKKGKEKEAYARGERVYFTAQQAQAILDEMTDYEKSWMDAWREMEKLSKAAINETSMLLYGFRKAKVGNYVPIFRDPRYIGKEFEAVVTDSRLTSMGFMHERVNAHNPMMLMDLTNVINRQVRDVSDLYGFAVPTRNMTRIYNGKMAGDVTSVKEVINKTQGMEVGAYFEKLMGDLQGGSRVESSVLDKLRGATAAATLSMNPTVRIKQAASYPTAAAVLGWAPLMKAMKYANPVFLKNFHPETEIDPYTSAHWERRSQNLSDLEANANRNTKASKLYHHLTNGIQRTDESTTAVIWMACGYYVEETQKDLKRGTEEFKMAQARVFEQALEATQPEYGVMQRPQVLRSNNQLVKQFTMYKTQSLQNFGILVDAVTNLSDKTKAVKQNNSAENQAALKDAKIYMARASSSLITGAIVLGIMTALGQMLKHKLGGYRDDKGDLTAESVGTQVFKDSVSSMAGMVVGGSEVFDFINGLIEGKAPYDIEASSASMINDAYQNLFALANAASTLADSDKTPEQKVQALLPKCRKLALSLTNLYGVPVGNMLNLVDGIAANAADIAAGKPGSFASASPLSIAGTPVIGSAQGRDTSNKAVAGYIAQAMMDGNEAEATRLYNEQLRQGKKADALNTAIATWQKANIPEIREAAQAIDSGDLTEYNRLINEIVGKGVSMTNAVKYVEAVRKKAEKEGNSQQAAGSSNSGTAMTYQEILDGMTKETATSEANAYTNGMMNSLLEDGNVDAAKAVRDDMLANGKKAAGINSSLTSYWKPKLQEAYANGDMAEVRRITSMLVEMGMKRTTVSGWTQEKSGSSRSSSKKKSGFGSGSFGSGSFGSSKKSSKKSGFGSGSFGSGKFGS